MKRLYPQIIKRADNKNPWNIGPDLSTQEFKPYWDNKESLWPMVLNQFSLNPTDLPGTISNDYGGYLPESYRRSRQREATRPAYNFASRIDRENVSRNLYTILRRSLATLGINPTTNQAKSLQGIVDNFASYAPIGFQLIDRLFPGNKSPVISMLRKGYDALHGSQGSIMPMYQQAQKQVRFMPLGQQDAFIQSYLQGLNSNPNARNGFTYQDLAGIHDYALSQGYNPLIR